MGQDLLRGNPAAVELLDPPDLFGFQPAYVAENSLDGEASKKYDRFERKSSTFSRIAITSCGFRTG